MRARLIAAVRRNPIAVVGSVVVFGLAVNAWIQDGAWPLLVVAVASLGCTAVILGLGWTSGAMVVNHARQTQAAIKAGHQHQTRAAIEAGINPRELRR